MKLCIEILMMKWFLYLDLTESGMNIEKKDQTEHHKKMFELSR